MVEEDVDVVDGWDAKLVEEASISRALACMMIVWLVWFGLICCWLD